MYFLSLLFFFCKQKTAYEMRISDWSSDVCSSDLFLETPDFGCVGGDEFHLPPLRVGIALVHAEQVAREQGGFVAAGACADFQHGRAGVGGIPGQQLQREGAFGVGQPADRQSTRLTSSHSCASRMPSSACKNTTSHEYWKKCKHRN